MIIVGDNVQSNFCVPVRTSRLGYCFHWLSYWKLVEREGLYLLGLCRIVVTTAYNILTVIYIHSNQTISILSSPMWHSDSDRQLLRYGTLFSLPFSSCFGLFRERLYAWSHIDYTKNDVRDVSVKKPTRLSLVCWDVGLKKLGILLFV